MKRQVSEKTLELNITAELLQIIRSVPGCENAFWMGMKQNQEAKLGIDELIRNVPSGFHLALQFKSPKPLPKNSLPYRFTINDRQNNNLLRLARMKPDAVYYILPHYNTLSRLRTSAPTLLVNTCSIKVIDLNGLTTSRNRNGTHSLYSYGTYAEIYSQPYRVDTILAKRLIGDILQKQDYFEKILFDHKSLKDWLETTYKEAQMNPYKVGRLLRGFSTICIS